MIIADEAAEQFAARERARAALASASTQADTFREMRGKVVDGVPPAPAAPVAGDLPTAEALASVQRALDAELRVEQAHRQEIGRKRTQIEANNRRRTQVIAGLIALPVVLVLLLILLVV